MSLKIIKDKFLYLRKVIEDTAHSELIDIYISTCDNFLENKELDIEEEVEITLNTILLQYDYILIDYPIETK